MSAAFSIEKPTIVATLPRPIDHSTGRYVVSDVHGGIPGSRKRKRSELAVGVDGEGLNIYDIQSSKLVTSYAIPPQSSFTCPPCSLRLKKRTSREVERRTYVSTDDTISKITFFRESAAADGATTSSVTVRELDAKNQRVLWLMTVLDQVDANREDLVAIHEDGEIQCLDGDTLKTKWISPATTIARNTAMPELINHKVEFAQLTDVHTASKKLLQDRDDIMSAFPQEISANGFNPQLLVIITSPVDSALLSDRTLHIVSFPSKISNYSAGNTYSVNTLLSVALPWAYQNKPDEIGRIVYNLQVTSGVLYELGGGHVTALELSGSQPRIQPQLFVEGASSFLPLSSSTIITASDDFVGIYDRFFQSIQASMSLSRSSWLVSKKRKLDGETLPVPPKGCRLVAYSAKLGVVHAIAGSDLLAFRIDSRQDTRGRRHTLGLLIDSIGCGAEQNTTTSVTKTNLIGLKSFRSDTADSARQRVETIISKMDKCIVQQDIEAFEKLMSQEVGLKRDETELRRWKDRREAKKQSNGVPATNGLHKTNAEQITIGAKPIPNWLWPKRGVEYPYFDPRLAQYAITRIFTWKTGSRPVEMENSDGSDNGRLAIVFFPHNVVNWLIETGSLTRTGIQSVLRHNGQLDFAQEIPTGQLLDVLVEIDPELKMLLSLLSSTYLNASELLHGVRLLMQSLELFGDQPSPDQYLLTNGEFQNPVSGDVDAEIEIEQENAAEALSLAEYHLGAYSSIRGRGLSLALAKLHACPDSAVVVALRSGFTSAEIVSLVYLLRFELARGAWTSRYLDTNPNEIGDDEAGHGNTILLVSGLLSCCIDAIGAGGWLSGDSRLINGDLFESEELIASLKLEVSAALEGIEEASYLKGLTTEMVRYGESVRAGLLGSTQSHTKRAPRPIRLPVVGREAAMLPFGLKVDQQVSQLRVGAGGELSQRTARDIGRLKSRKVGKYSRERIVI